jgi:hypothetical protein
MKRGLICATLDCTVLSALRKRLQTSHKTDYTVNDCEGLVIQRWPTEAGEWYVEKGYA